MVVVDSCYEEDLLGRSVAPAFTSVVAGAQAGHAELTNETGIVEPNPLTLTLYSDATHRNIMENPMVEEFVALLVGSRIVVWPCLEWLMSPSAPPATG